MKAVIFAANNEVSLTDLPDPNAGPDKVVVEVKASGICLTDYDVLKDTYGTGAFPVVPGHEYAGVVVAVSGNVTNIKAGDLVAVDPNIECGICRACKRGWAHLCENLGAYRVTTHGGFAELSVMTADRVHSIGDMSFLRGIGGTDGLRIKLHGRGSRGVDGEGADRRGGAYGNAHGVGVAIPRR